jgi:hypothetical protein
LHGRGARGIIAVVFWSGIPFIRAGHK